MAYIGKQPAVAALTASDITDGIVSNAKLAQDIISADTALGAEPADTDEFLVSDAGTLKRMDYSYIKAGGITEADMWYTNSNQSISGGTGTVATNWARVTETGFGQIGTGMTHSSGIFTFPSTGYYLVVFNMQAFHDDENKSVQAQLDFTTNDSTYGSTSTGWNNISEADAYGGAYTEFVFDITDVSNQKVRTRVFGSVDFTLWGDASDRVYTSIRFMKLADT